MQWCKPILEHRYALCEFQGRLLVGVGNILRLYDLGKKQLLRKSEVRVGNMITSIHTLGDRIYVGDVSDGFYFLKYHRVSNKMVVYVLCSSVCCAFERFTLTHTPYNMRNMKRQWYDWYILVWHTDSSRYSNTNSRTTHTHTGTLKMWHLDFSHDPYISITTQCLAQTSSETCLPVECPTK